MARSKETKDEEYNHVTLHNASHTMKEAADILERRFGNSKIVKDLRRGSRAVKAAARIVPKRKTFR